MRDWFKDRRTDEETPRIVEEKKSELFLSNGNTNTNVTIKVKQELVDFFEEEAPSNPIGTEEAVEVVKVKKEPLEEEEEEEGPVSAVLRSKVIPLSMPI